MHIGGVDIGRQVLVVAEIGNNHEGDFGLAQELVRRAAGCGVHAVKFQTFRTKYFVSTRDTARYKRLASFELSYAQFERLQALTKSLGVLFLSTPLDLESARFLEPLVDSYKIASGDNNFYALLEVVCETGKPIVMSTGLSDFGRVAGSKRFIEEQWRSRGIVQELAVLHCVSSYPVPPEQANLLAIPFLASRLGCTVGYSDHTIGGEACLVAVALGARIIEKHFTLDKRYSDFRDHQLSTDPPEMAELVRRVHEVTVLLGSGEKVPQENEKKTEHLFRRSIVAAADLPAGHRVGFEDITWTRPAVGLPPGDEVLVVGKRLKRPLEFGEPITSADLE